MWEISRVRNPMLHFTPVSWPRLPFQALMASRKSSIMDTPVMISALVRGMLLTVRQMLRNRRRRLRNPMAAAVPMTVEITAARAETASVTASALRIMSFWKSCRRAQICRYQSRVKPAHTALLLEALKEKTTRTRMGA